MKQLTSVEQLIGKAITAIKKTEFNSYMAIHFDSEFAVFEVDSGWESEDKWISIIKEGINDYLDNEKLFILGMISQQELDVRKKANKAKREKRVEANERLTYERLKKKYE